MALMSKLTVLPVEVLPFVLLSVDALPSVLLPVDVLPSALLPVEVLPLVFESALSSVEAFFFFFVVLSALLPDSFFESLLDGEVCSV